MVLWFRYRVHGNRAASLLITIICLARYQGNRHLGNEPAGGLGVSDHQFCLVDRYWPRRNAYFFHSAAFKPEVANLYKPVCRGTDAFRRGLRGYISRFSYRASMVGILALSLSQYDVNMAAVPQSVDLGRFCGFDLCYGFGFCSGT